MERKNLQNFDEIKLRLLQFAESQEIPKGELYEKISMFPSNFAGKGAESALKSDNIVKVLTEFPELNSDWLLLGRGEMLRPGTPAADGNHHGSDPVAAILEKIIAEKDNRIEALVRDNERLRQQLDTEREKSASQSAATASV